MEELNLFARNPHWIAMGLHADDGHDHAITEVDVTALDQLVLVDQQVAIAFTNMTHHELIKQVPHTSLARRPYRLADLEKLRIEKMTRLMA